MKMIVCVSENYGIGKDGELLFSIPEDMKLFRTETSGKVVVMGRATLESFPGGKPLKNRVNIVLTNSPDYSCEGAVVVHSFDEAMEKISQYPSENVYIIGGESIYKMFENVCNEAIVTKVQQTVDADKFFFNIDETPGWKLAETSTIMEYENFKYTFNKYTKD